MLVKSSPLTSADVDASAMQGTVKVGWIYNTVTGQFMVNSTATPASGEAPSAL
ncbi:MAG: hypothetical protein JSS49_13805 [Planctomycetes bacterium]|nr:hypothetical protein [Planctomycetota bacterium]